jgi:predicted AlkP superfamily pyrophosphatase or phosphodiesterase
MAKRLLVIQVAALGADLLRESGVTSVAGLAVQSAETVLPAVTCTVQASFRTASAPASHGMIANGVFARHLDKVLFWEQSASLVAGERIWEGFRGRGGKVAMLFWQQSLGERVDMLLSPAPIHKHHGGMIQDCYAQPAGLYQRLCQAVGRPFKLQHYWGPLASWKSGQWIAEATAALLGEPDAPDLALAYLPTLDYDLQRHNPSGSSAKATLLKALGQLTFLIGRARSAGYEVVLFGDYQIRPANHVVFPNRLLAEAGLFKTRPVADMLYPDFYTSRAFAMVDHQIAHVYVRDASDIPAAREVLSQAVGIEEIADRAVQAALALDSPNSGELVLLAAGGTWFAYPWWTARRQAPDYASHIDIHNKPGYDPCELFFGFPPPRVSQSVGRIRGSHGRAGNERVAWAASIDLGPIGSIIDLATAVKNWLE